MLDEQRSSGRVVTRRDKPSLVVVAT
jgi:hypothetical protein